MKILQWVWFLVLAIMLPGLVLGQDEQPPQRSVFSSDRPSFTTGPILMEVEVWQLELGYVYRETSAEKEIGSFPNTLVRYGLNEKIELRFGWNGYDFVDNMDDEAGDTSFGFKYYLGKDILGTDSMSLIATLSIPTGSGQSELDPQFLLSWDHALDETTTLSGNIGVGFPSDEITGDRFTQGIFSLMCSKKVDKDTSIFGEYYTNFPAADEADCEHILQAGVLRMIDFDTQLDLHAGIGLNDQSDDWLIGVGFSHRF